MGQCGSTAAVDDTMDDATGAAETDPLVAGDDDLSSLDDLKKFFGYEQDERENFRDLEKGAPWGVFYDVPERLGDMKWVQSRKRGADPTWKDPDDGSLTELSEEERGNRERYNGRRCQLPIPPMKELWTLHEVLDDRPLPCLLALEGQSRSSSYNDYRERAYPLRFHAWDDLTKEVIDYQPPDRKFKVPVDSVYRSCWLYRKITREESHERAYLMDKVLEGLARVYEFGHCTAGRPDDCINSDDGSPALVIEEKPTQNLRLPKTADDIVGAYSKYDWRVTHPLGQLARQMLLNNCRYGVLTSGTRTYFVCAVVVDGEVRFFVSRRWYVAERYYLRAWAFVTDAAKIAKRDVKDKAPKPSMLELKCAGNGWRKFEGDKNTALSPSKSPTLKTKMPRHFAPRSALNACLPKRRKSSGGPVAAETPDDEPWERSNRLGVPEVPDDALQIHWDRVLGRGRNGAVVEARWSGQTIALKQFDLDHGCGPHFQRELETYVALRRLQGKAVARLLFVSRSWCGTLRFMGIEKGEPVKGDEANLEDEMVRVHHTLQLAGWRQTVEENELKNHVWQVDGRLVAIDLEMFEIVPKTS